MYISECDSFFYRVFNNPIISQVLASSMEISAPFNVLTAASSDARDAQGKPRPMRCRISILPVQSGNIPERIRSTPMAMPSVRPSLGGSLYIGTR